MFLWKLDSVIEQSITFETSAWVLHLANLESVVSDIDLSTRSELGRLDNTKSAAVRWITLDHFDIWFEFRFLEN